MKNELTELESVLIELNRTPFGRRAFLASLPILMASCATAPRHREREGENIQTEMTPDQERKMTEEVLPEMKKEYPAIQNADLQNYINRLGQDLVQKNGLVGNPYQYTFTVVGVPYVNAFALPAGTVFITAPLLSMAENEAELAGVVGHEVGHIKAKHTAQRMEKAKKEESKGLWYAIGGGLLGGAAGFGLGKVLCRNQDKECLARATALGAAAGAGGGLLIQKYAFMANSREDEMEADRIGFKTSVRAGFDPVACGTFYEKLLKMEEESKQNRSGIELAIADAMATHPPSKERVIQMKELAAQTQVKGRVSSEEFQRMQALARSWVQQNTKKA